MTQVPGTLFHRGAGEKGGGEREVKIRPGLRSSDLNQTFCHCDHLSPCPQDWHLRCGIRVNVPAQQVTCCSRVSWWFMWGKRFVQ